MTIKNQTIYPTIGEVLNEASAMFYSKPSYTNDSGNPSYKSARKIDQLSGYGAFKVDYSSISQSISTVFSSPFIDDDDFTNFLRNCGHAIIGQYIQMIKGYALDGFTRKQSIPWLVENHACKFICDAIGSIAKAHGNKWNGLNLFEDYFPIKNAFLWLESSFPEFKEFKKTYGIKDKEDWLAIKGVRDKIGKWARGIDIPTNDGLWGQNGLLQLFYKAHQIDNNNQKIINEVVFLARALQVFFKKTKGLKTLENLQLMNNNRYVILPEAVLLKRLHGNSDQEMEKAKPYLLCLEELRDLLVNQKGRQEGEREEVYKLLTTARKMIEDDPQYSPNWWYLSRYYGLWHEFNGETEKAILSYTEAIDGFLYSGSPHAKKVFRETLTLCCKAHLEGITRVKSKNLKSYIKRLKAQGRIFDFYHPWKLDEEDISKEEAEIWASYYWQYFPKSLKF